MDKAFNYLVKGTFNVMKGLLLSVLMVCIVVSLVRHPPGRLRSIFNRRRYHNAIR